MIQFNLLPDVKLEYIKARRTKRLVILGSAITTGVSVTILVILFIGVNVVQGRHMRALRDDIHHDSEELQKTPDLNKILTVQNQLNILNDLHDRKPAVERVSDYITQVTPSDVSFSDVKVDFTTNTISFVGVAKSLKAVNQFVDTLKFTTYDIGEGTKNAFSGVVLSSFDRSDTEDSDDAPVSFQVDLAYDLTIFDITKTNDEKQSTIKLLVPEQTSTRSVTEKPATLFESQPQPEGGM